MTNTYLLEDIKAWISTFTKNQKIEFVNQMNKHCSRDMITPLSIQQHNYILKKYVRHYEISKGTANEKKTNQKRT